MDAHAHIFNASDLQVERFISRIVARSLPRCLSGLLGYLIQWAGWGAAPTGAEELARLEEYDAIDARRPQDAAALLARDRRDGLDRFARAFGEALRTPLGEEFLQRYARHRARRMSRKRSRSAADRAVQKFDVDELKQPDRLLAYLDLERRVSGIGEIFNFVSRFFQYRYVNATYLFETYGWKSRLVPSQGAGVFACCLVDYDFPLDAGSSPPPTCLDQQIEVMAKIASWSHGRVLPFVPFDPWRWVYEGESALTRVAQAIADGRAVGVKIYPPMGFAPAGNAELQPPFPPSWPFEDFEDFDERLHMAMGDMLSWCAREGAPVVAHANQSNGPDAIAETLGGPLHWKRAIAAHPDLRVSFAHAGGQSLLEAVNHWPDKFAARFKEGRHVYGDWAYFESVLAPSTRDAFVGRAREFFARNGPIARQRIMYGSDWLLLGMESGSASYLQAFEDVMGRLEPEFPGLAERFFVWNALDYLGLGPNDATRRRLVGFLAKNGVRAEWLHAADQGSSGRAPQPGVPNLRARKRRATKMRRARADRHAG